MTMTEEMMAREYGWRCWQALQSFNARRAYVPASDGELQRLAHLAWAYGKQAWHHAALVATAVEKQP